MENILTPAERARLALERAERAALIADWEEYRKLEDRYRDVRFPPKRITHGITGYGYHKCRCDVCRAAVAKYARARRKKIRESLPQEPKKQPKGRPGRTVKPRMHGTLTGYSYGCRCVDCTTAHRKARPKSKIKKHGTEYGYKQGCRCRSCVKAQRDARRKRYQENPPPPLPEKLKTQKRDQRRAQVQALREHYRNNPHLIPDRVHGTTRGYKDYVCRCAECKRANTESAKRYRQRRRDAEANKNGGI